MTQDLPQELPGAAEIAALFAPARGARSILLAVSGGPDSMALLRLAALWRDAGGAPQLSVATVDHGLRPQARAEAARVAQWSNAQGLTHASLVWPGPKPTTRLQEAAREARYRLLAAHAAALGAEFIALAHHRDDQAETVLFRLARGSGIDGLAGMETLAQRGAVTLFRPLLAWPKARLVALCRTLGQLYIDDPSNADPRFARTRLRRLGAALAQEGLDAPGLARLALRAGRARDALAAQSRDMMTQIAPEVTAQGLGASLEANLAPLANAPEEIVLRIIGALIAQVAGPDQPLRLDALERLCGRLLPALLARTRFTATLAGAQLALDAAQRIIIRPENPRRCGRKAD